LIENDKNPRARVRLRDHSINRLIPNILTLFALCAGLSSIRFALAERWEHALIAILIAAVCDALDGRIARMLDSASRFGAELDSLADFISFGVAPAIVLYLWTLDQIGSVGWAFTLLYASCMALRLARFNAKLDNADLPAWTGRFFTGVPAPAGAALALLPLAGWLEYGSGFFDRPFVVGFIMLGVTGLLVSRLPTYSFKRLKVTPAWVLPTMLLVALYTSLLISTPWNTLLFTACAYLCSLPLSYMSYRRLERRRTPSLVPTEDESDRDRV